MIKPIRSTRVLGEVAGALGLYDKSMVLQSVRGCCLQLNFYFYRPRSIKNMPRIVNLLRSYWLLQVALQFSIILGLGLAFRLTPSFEGTIQALWQFLPPSLIEQYGWVSLYYLHQQPPLLNGIVLVIIKIWGRAALEPCIAVLMLALLFVNLALINRLIVALEFKPLFGWLFVLFPAFWLYHTWFYEPAFTLLFTNCVFLGLIRKPTPSSFLLTVLGLVGLTLAHGSFHPVIILGVLALAWLLCFRLTNLRSVRLAAICLLALPLLFLIKNSILVGSPSLSSWAGCNLHQKFMHIGKGFEYTPQEIPNLPNILGAAALVDGKRLNTNNVDFAAHCNANLRLIVSKITEPGEFSGYLSRVFETIRNNESSLSLEYRGAGFSPSHWGRLNPAIEWVISFKTYYATLLLLISLFCPVLALTLLRRHALFKPLFILTLIYYFGLSIAHLANGWEQMRMAYRSSFFVYCCVLLFGQGLLRLRFSK